MANIWNETMIQLYKTNQLPISKGDFLYNGKKLYMKNNLYGYAYYEPKTKEFINTLGYKGLYIINKLFKLGVNNYTHTIENAEYDYLEIVKHLHLKNNWWLIDFRTKQGRTFKEKLKPIVMLYFKL